MAAKVNQRLIARELNLSVGTISKALNHDPSIRAETRRAVSNAARKMGYRLPGNRPRAKRDGVGGGRDGHCFVMVLVRWDHDVRRQPPHTAASGFLAGLSSIARLRNVSLVLHHVSAAECAVLHEPRHQPPALRDRLVDGVVLMHRFEPEVVCGLTRQVPCVSLIHHVPEAGIDHVDADHATALDALVGRLWSAGHRQIGFVGLNDAVAYTVARHASYARALIRRGVWPDRAASVTLPEAALRGEAEHPAWAAAVDAVAGQIGRGVTGWAAASDWAGYRIILGLRRRGVEVPAAASFTGFDGLVTPPGLPPLCTAHPPFERIGAAALFRLVDRQQRPDEPTRQILLSCELIDGETIAPPPKGS